MQYLVQNKNVQVKLIPSSSSSLVKLDFSWKITELAFDKFIVKLDFTNPELISIYKEKDAIEIQFFNTHQFMIDKN